MKAKYRQLTYIPDSFSMYSAVQFHSLYILEKGNQKLSYFQNHCSFNRKLKTRPDLINNAVTS